MAFHYDIASADATLKTLSELRLEIGDTEENAGPRPRNQNFSDAELQLLLDREGDTMRAAAAACETLARQWARVASAQVGQLRNDYNHVSETYRQQAQDLRAQYGGGASGIAVAVERSDGYADAAASAEVDE